MGARGRIAILIDAREAPAQLPEYRIWHCVPFWEARGLEVRWLRGVDRPADADLVIPQIDRSVLPDAVRRFLAAVPRALNRDVIDIRKTVISRNLIREHDAYDGPVIVKTAANYGGRPERRLTRRLPAHRRALDLLAALGRRTARVVRTGSLARLAHAERLDPNAYPIYPSPRALPRAVFRNPALVVERFRPERDGALYCLRSYAFLGDRAVTVRTRAPHPIVKGIRGSALEVVPVDDRIVGERTRLGLDYGKIDYVLDAGEAVLLDVNPTPTFGRVYPLELRVAIAAELAGGIARWLP